MADTPEEIKSHFKQYLVIGGILFIGTVLTVAVATIPWMDIGGHGFDRDDCILGLAIATTKATLVALIFMHLNHEKKAIYWIFLGALAFGAILIALFGFAMYDPITFDTLLPEHPGQ
ncbi:cytochrome C oxidase subunit IV family protein [Rubritalea tangerina]|uniref:Cytochrome C oxidase subunit IV family protein n=1 Tax=Rubritalea tangerina TaxID=430798 RepID=A0ABW4ZD83_9BACT